MRFLCFVLTLSLLLGPSASYAGGALEALRLPLPGTMLASSSRLTPPLLKGMVVNLNDPLAFRFIIDSGRASVPDADLRAAVQQQVKYFLTGLTVPSKDLWVNLSPYEKDRMIPDALGKTDLGRDMLAQDYILKQLSATMIHPDKDLGKAFWARVYAQAKEKFGTIDIPVDTFNKVWIMPDTAVIFEQGTRGYITKATLKVLLDEDYLALEKGRAEGAVSAQAPAEDMQARALTTRVMREIVIPAITREVNEGSNFTALRQIYYALVLAKWYKETVSNQLLARVYFGKNRVAGVELAEPGVRDEIYQRYVEAYKKGVFNFIKEEADPATGEAAPHRYFSGGERLDLALIPLVGTANPAAVTSDGVVSTVDINLVWPESPDAQHLSRLIKKVGFGFLLSDKEMEWINGVLKQRGLPARKLPASRVGREKEDQLIFLQTFSEQLPLIEQFDPKEEPASDDETVIARKNIEILSNGAPIHDLSHLAHAAGLISLVFSFEDQLSADSRTELDGLYERAQQLQQKNELIRKVLVSLAADGSPSPAFAVFLWKRIDQHLREAKEMVVLLKAFIKHNDYRVDDFKGLYRYAVEYEESVFSFDEDYIWTKAEDHSLTDKDVDLPVAMDAVVKELKKRFKKIDIDFTSDGELLAPFLVSYGQLKASLIVLIANANAKEVRARHVKVAIKYEEKETILTVQDDGPVASGPMPLAVLRTINEGRVVSTKGDFGSGAGLMVVREFLLKHHGDGVKAMQVESTSTATTFTLRLPLENSVSNTQAADPNDPAAVVSTPGVNGGIDVSEINVARAGKGLQVVVDPAQLAAFSRADFKGFQANIVGMAPAGSVLSALGL